MKRSKAEALLDAIRQELVYQPDNASRVNAIVKAFERYGVLPLALCSGEAHRNPHIDHCHLCAPRWGVVGERVRIT